MTLHLSSAVSYPLINPEGSHRRYLMFSIEVPVVETRRQPLNLALVIDRSGSMGGGKLERAKEAARLLVNNLTPDDRVALVAFESDVVILAHSTHVTRDARPELLGAIEGLSTEGMTALHGGWLVGAQQVANFVDGERVSRVLVLTDGHANVGVTDPEQITREARELRQRGVETSTMGIGADFDQGLLEPMARSGGGRFHFIPDEKSITDVVAGELGELRSLYARRTVVYVSLPRGVVLRRGLNEYEIDQSASGVRVYIGDLLSGDLKRVVLEVSTPPGSIGESLSVASRVTYMDVETNRHREQDFSPVGLRYGSVHAVHSQPVNQEVDREVSLLHAAHARDKASALSRDGHHDEALNILRETAGKLKRSPYASEPTFAAEAAAVQDLVRRAERGPLDELRRKEMGAASYALRQRKPRYDKGIPK